tara:strand:+ start:9385 stop:9831 length:447 start_codon:yes stop_codon:yes gene_type:complete
MNKDMKVVKELVEKYCVFNRSISELMTYVHGCLKKSMQFDLPSNYDPHFKYADCTIEYDKERMTFTLLKSADDAVGETLEMRATVQSYLNDYYGPTPAESLIKHIFFSDVDIADISHQIALDLNDWATSMEYVFKTNSYPPSMGIMTS